MYDFKSIPNFANFANDPKRPNHCHWNLALDTREQFLLSSGLNFK